MTTRQTGKLLHFLMIFFLFTSCEYDPNGINFKELTPPRDDIDTRILLNDIAPSDTIYLYQDTRLSIRLKEEDKKLRTVKIFLDDEEEYLWNNSLDFVVSPNQLGEGIHKLSVNAVFTTGSGSLADLMGLEGYIGEMSWYIRVNYHPDKDFKVGYRTNEKGFLEIYWDNAVPDHLIEKYIVHFGGFRGDTVIYDSKQKSIVDYGYVCGEEYYEIKTCLKSVGYSHTNKLTVSEPVPQIRFESMGIDSLRIYWDKPFANGQFKLSENEEPIFSGRSDTTITLPQEFGRNRWFQLEVRPLKADENSFDRLGNYNSFLLGTDLQLSNFPDFAYSKTENIIYTSNFDDLLAIDAATLKEKNRVQISGHPWGILYCGEVACAPHNSTIAAMTGEETWIYADSRFLNPIIISEAVDPVTSVRLNTLTGNDRLFVVRGRNIKECQVFNVKTGKKILNFQFAYTPNFDIPRGVAVSEDGRYFCGSSEDGIEILEIDGITVNKFYTDTRQYLGAMFLPSQTDKLLLRVGDNIEIRQMPGFNLIRLFEMKGAGILNIDPVTGYLLYYQDGYLKVAPVDRLNAPVFKVKSDVICKLLNNILLSRTGKALDITPYIHP